MSPDRAWYKITLIAFHHVKQSYDLLNIELSYNMQYLYDITRYNNGKHLHKH